MTKRARAHHYVPASYLAGFTPQGSQEDFLRVLDLKRVATREQRPREVGHERDYHTIEVDGADSDAFEKALGRIESPGVAAIHRVEEVGALPEGQDLHSLLSFIALMSVRSPSLRDTWNDFMSQVKYGILEQITATPQRFRDTLVRAGLDEDESHEEFSAAVRARAFELNVHPNRRAQHLLEMADTALACLSVRHWCLITRSADAGFFACSDRPVSLFHRPSGPRSPRGLGTADRVMMPLTRNLALAGGFEPETPGTARATALEVAMINTQTLAWAERFLAYPGPDLTWINPGRQLSSEQELLEFLRNRRAPADPR